MLKKVIVFLVIFPFFTALKGQELNCNIQINSDQVQGTNKSVFSTLQKSVAEFVNNRRWTELNFSPEERIDCNMTIIVKKVDGEMFSAEITVQSRRPIFNSSYNSTLFNFRDQDFNFIYKEFDVLEINENSITSNLTAVLSYYAYIILGYDMDSYSRLGGTPYFQAAEQIVSMAQSADLSGWKAFESNKNRYALVNNLRDETFSKFRNYIYDYHRLGLDEMTGNQVNARAKILAGIPDLRETNRSRPNAIAISSFLDAKTEELIQIIKGASSKEKETAVEIISDINPTLTDKFQAVFKP